MIFFIQDVINGNTQPVAILAKVAEEGQGVAHCSFKDMLLHANVLQSLAFKGEIVRLHAIDNFDKVLTWCDVSTSANFTAIAKALSPKIDTELSMSTFEAVASKIPAHLNITAKDIESFFNSFKEYVDYKKNGCTEKIEYSSEFLLDKAKTLVVIEEMNSKNSLSYLSADKNKTLFMNSPEDAVRIKLPSYEQITIGDDIVLPKPSNVFKPYVNGALFTARYKDCLGDIDIRTVTGDVLNNDLAIQSNENEFYHDMLELIDFGIKQRYPNVTLEECLKSGYDDPNVTDFLIELACTVAAWNWSHTGNYPVTPGLFVSNTGNDDDEDNDEDNSSDFSEKSEDESTRGSKIYIKDPTKINDDSINVDAEYFLKNYINKAMQGGNSYAPAEAVVKLLRWGNRKPSRLKLNGVSTYLDLNTFKYQEMSGSFENLEIVKVEGATYDILGLITAMDKVKDMNYVKSLGYETSSLNIPVGVLATKSYKGGIEQLVAFSIPTLLKFLENHDGDVRGISVKDYKVETTLELDEESTSVQAVIGAISKSANSEKIFYRSEEMIDMYMAYQALTTSTSELTILQKFIGMNDIVGEISAKSFSNSTELMEKYSIENNLNLDEETIQKGKKYLKGMTGLRDYFDATVAKELLPVVLDVADNNYKLRLSGKEATLSDILNFYMLAMTKHNYDSRNKLQDEGAISKDSPAGKIAGDLQAMSTFGGDKLEQVDNKEEPASIPTNITGTIPAFVNHLILAIPDNATLTSLYYVPPKSTEVILGYLTQVKDAEGKPRYCLTSTPGNKQVTKRMKAEQIVRASLLDYFKVATGDIATTALRFDSAKSWGEIAKAIVEHIK